MRRNYNVAGRRKTGSSKAQALGTTTSTSSGRQPQIGGTGDETIRSSNEVLVQMGVLNRDKEINPTPISFGGSGARFNSLRIGMG